MTFIKTNFVFQSRFGYFPEESLDFCVLKALTNMPPPGRIVQEVRSTGGTLVGRHIRVEYSPRFISLTINFSSDNPYDLYPCTEEEVNSYVMMNSERL